MENKLKSAHILADAWYPGDPHFHHMIEMEEEKLRPEYVEHVKRNELIQLVRAKNDRDLMIKELTKNAK